MGKKPQFLFTIDNPNYTYMVKYASIFKIYYLDKLEFIDQMNFRKEHRNVIKDIQHVGSTSIISIKAKPIIDIAVAVDNFEDVLALKKELEFAGFYYRPQSKPALKSQLLFACGSYYDGSGNLQTHFIHVVHTNSVDWINYINFRDYLNNTPLAAKEYENLKILLASKVPINGGREEYCNGKCDFITQILKKASVTS